MYFVHQCSLRTIHRFPLGTIVCQRERESESTQSQNLVNDEARSVAMTLPEGESRINIILDLD